jgi:poly(3-hydroxybutyrate) depolymerase
MILATALLASTSGYRQNAPQPIVIKEGLSISGISAAGRLPFAFDFIQDQIVNGTWKMPNAGDTPSSPTGSTAKWRKRTADKDNSFGTLPNGYLVASVDVGIDVNWVLEATGDSVVYVNGVPRAGDPYGYGYLRVPVRLQKGKNTLIFGVGRGGFSAKLTPPRATVQIETGDLTLPDVIVDGPRELWAGVVLVNNSVRDERVSVFARNSAGNAPMVSVEIPAQSFRKVPVKLSVPEGDLGKEQKFEIECVQSKLIDKATITLAVKKSNETHKETFISSIDGSVQYYGVNPAQKPSNSNALVLTLHGASVEGIGQASAYGSKDWCTLVAATNRRPYGFDWEDIGRLDALEVLNLAKKEFPHEADSVHLTGHSMGGHGTWSIGTLYPDLFASIAPSAGWISFWTYAGGYHPASPSPVESLLVRAMAGSDTLARVDNTLEEKVYILHGDADDNVPVDEARHMKTVLTSINADFGYHEQPGAGHWWGGQCVDWPGIFDQIKTSRIEARKQINFTTPSPAISSHDEWATILEQTHAMEPSQVKIGDSEGTTKNVHVLQLGKPFVSLTLDGQKLGKVRSGAQLFNTNGEWHVDHLKDGWKSPELSGPFKNVYQNHFVFVVGTHGTTEENEWAAQRARYDAETFQYRGNGSVDIVTDSKYNAGWQRNVILYGNADTNSAWNVLLKNSPIQVHRGKLSVGDKVLEGNDLGSLFVYPHHAHGKWVLVGVISGTGVVGSKASDRLPIFTSGVAYPDWTVFGAGVLTKGTHGIKACGFFGNDWSLTSGDAAWNQ